MTIRSVAISATAALLIISSPVLAGPFRDAESEIAAAYADYRTALFQTNQNNRAATEAALSSFRTKWSAMALKWKSTPPPQYADDVAFESTIETVTKLADEATALASSGNLSKSHDVLEGIRDALGTLRARNGIVSISDRMNAYHAHMEHVLEHKYDTLAELSDDVAILSYLAAEIGANRPQNVDSSSFDQALRAVTTSIATLKAAVRSGDPAAADGARRGLKGPYSRMFIRFG
ncbi:MAG: hypothetical protein ACRCWF_09125 [Beijerinckiaceae bacterium]